MSRLTQMFYILHRKIKNTADMYIHTVKKTSNRIRKHWEEMTAQPNRKGVWRSKEKLRVSNGGVCGWAEEDMKLEL